MYTRLKGVRIPLLVIMALILLAIGSCWERTAHAQHRGVDSVRGNTHNGYFGPENDFSQRFTYRNNIEPLEQTRRRQQQYVSPSFDTGRGSGGGVYNSGDLPYFDLLGGEASQGPSSGTDLPGAFIPGPKAYEGREHLTPTWPSQNITEWFSSRR